MGVVLVGFVTVTGIWAKALESKSISAIKERRTAALFEPREWTLVFMFIFGRIELRVENPLRAKEERFWMFWEMKRPRREGRVAATDVADVDLSTPKMRRDRKVDVEQGAGVEFMC